MTIKDYKFQYLASMDYPYNEETQSSNMRWCPVEVDHAGKNIWAKRYPFQCREFLSDLVFWWAGHGGSMYGMELRPAELSDLDHSYMGLMTDCDEEAAVLRELSEYEVDTSKVGMPALDGIGWGEDEVYIKYCFVIRIPKYARTSPLGMLLWSMGIRGHVENKEITPDEYGFGIPEPLGRGNNADILDDMYKGDGCDLLTKLWARKRTFLWDVPSADDEEMFIGECTHEMFSPVTLFSNLSSATRFERFIDMAESDEWGEHYYQVDQLKLLRDLNS